MRSSVTLDEQLVLGQVVRLDRGTVYLSERPIGVIDYNRQLDAYTSSIDRDPRSLADQLELLVRADQRRGGR